MRRVIAVCLGLAFAACGGESRFGSPSRVARPAYTAPAKGAESADALDSKPPSTGEPPPTRMPAVRDGRLACGARLITVERHKPLPVAVIRAVIDRGTADLPPGVGALLARSMFTGTKIRSDVVVGQELDEMGAKASAAASYDTIAVTLEVPRANLDAAIRLLADILRNANFPEEPVVRIRQRMLANQDWRSATPRAFAYDALLAQLFPENHPYRDLENGSVATVGPRTPEELREARRTVFVPKRTTFVIAGDFDERALVARLDKELLGWQGDGPLPATLPPVDKRPRRITIFDHPGDSQVAIAIGAQGIPWASEDAPTLRLIASILGGGMTSRLGRAIRIGHGASYGIYAESETYRGAGIVTITGSVERDHTAEALHDVFAAIDSIRTDKLDPHDVPAARADEAVRLSTSLETLGDLVSFLSRAAAYGASPDDVFARWRAPQKVSLEEIHRVANRYLTPDAMQVVLVGDAAQISSNVSSMGTVEVRQLR